MDKRTVNRRIFLSKSTACMAGVGIAGSGAMFGREISPREQLQPEIREYRTLGRTGFKVSDIGCGFPGTASESVLKAAVAGGIMDEGYPSIYVNLRVPVKISTAAIGDG